MRKLIRLLTVLLLLQLLPVPSVLAQHGKTIPQSQDQRITPADKTAELQIKQEAQEGRDNEATIKHPDINYEKAFAESQRNLDRTLSALNVVVTAIGVLIGVLAIIATIVIAYVARSAHSWNQIKKSAQKEASIIKTIREKAEKDVVDLRRELDKKPTPPLTVDVPEEYKEKVDELARKLELQEVLGIFLRPEEYSMRASDLFYKGKYHLAIEALNKALELKPDYAEAWSNKGAVFQRLNRSQEALNSVDKAIQINPSYYPAWLNKSAFLLSMGRFDEALIAVEKALELNPSDPGAWDNKGLILANIKGKEEDSLLAFDKAIDLSPGNPNAWTHKAHGLLILQRYEDALRAANKALELTSPPPEAWLRKASALYHLGRYAETLEAAKKAVDLMPQSATALVGKAVALMKLGNQSEAEEALNRASEIAPASGDVLYNKACLSSTGRDKARALAFLSEAATIDAGFRKMARSDDDFRWLWDDAEFKVLTAE